MKCILVTNQFVNNQQRNHLLQFSYIMALDYSKTKLVFKTSNHLMKVKSIAECSKCGILQYYISTFIKLSIVTKIFVLSIFEWPFYTGFTVHFK